MKHRNDDAPPESDRFDETLHPRDTQALFGHQEAERGLLESYKAGRLPQALIIGGRQGIGKATLAWRLARFLAVHPDPGAPAAQRAENLATDPDHPAVRKISAMSFGDLALLRRGWNEKTKKHFTRIAVDDVREVLRLFEQASGAGGWRMAIIDSADDLNPSSANALLKVIEEPPPKSLFLIVAHNPGRILPTIRSRCRRLMLKPLAESDLRQAVETALSQAEIRADAARIDSACDRAEGAPREALRLLSNADAEFDARVESVLKGLPRVNWPVAHGVADRLAGDETAFQAFLAAIFSWLSAGLRQGKALGPRAVAPYAEAWEQLEREARELAIFNLDKRAFTVLAFDLLAQTAREAAEA